MTFHGKVILDGGCESSLLRHLLKILLCPLVFTGELHLSDIPAFIYWFAVCWLGQQELWTWSTSLAVSAWRTPDQKERGWRRPKPSTKVWVTLATSSWLSATRWVPRLACKKRLQAHPGNKLITTCSSRFLQETPIPYRDCKLISKTGDHPHLCILQDTHPHPMQRLLVHPSNTERLQI